MVTTNTLQRLSLHIARQTLDTWCCALHVGVVVDSVGRLYAALPLSASFTDG